MDRPADENAPDTTELHLKAEQPWDGRQGTAATDRAIVGYNILATGGSTAFSTILLTATCLVNTAPELNV